jgi:RimJ/RimL family protein N-acetyltransferase
LLGPVLEGPNVRLEPIGEQLAHVILSGRAGPELAWAVGFPMAPLLDLLTKAIEFPETGIVFGPFLAYVIIRRADGLAVGDAGFHGPPRSDGEVEVGYALSSPARGAGLATESVGLLAEWALVQPAVQLVTARVAPDNTPSVRLLERLGFGRDGERDGLIRFVLRA